MLEEINDYSPDKVTTTCDGAHFQSNPPAPVHVKTCLYACSWLHLHVNARKDIDGVCPRTCVFVSVSYPVPLIIAGHFHVWHLPLTSAPQQAQLLKGQTPQRMSITSTPSPLLPPFWTLPFSTSDSPVALIWREKKKRVKLTYSLRASSFHDCTLLFFQALLSAVFMSFHFCFSFHLWCIFSTL